MVACYGRPRKHIREEVWESSVQSAVAECRDDTAEGATWTLFHNDLTKARKREEFIMQSHLLLVNGGPGGLLTLTMPTRACSSPSQWHPMFWQRQVWSGRQVANIEGKTLWSGTHERSVRPSIPRTGWICSFLAVERVKGSCKVLRRSVRVVMTHTTQAPRGK